jgi:hypothetical protein
MPLLAFALFFIRLGDSQPQTFSSGSTGADGALNITAPGVTYFNPTALSLNPAIPNIYNFTTITIAPGSTLKFTEEVFHGPVFFLASGNVTINGTLDLSGANGASAGSQSQRQVSYAGSGGYGGGLGGVPGGTPPPQPGNGPGGGAAGTATSLTGAPGQFTGNQYLVPLIGGSGGGGAYVQSGPSCVGASGGAGGGAILIASSTSIAVSNTGLITAAGGNATGGCNSSSAGSGGAIRLVANTITYNGGGGSPCGATNLSVAGGILVTGAHASSGIIRIESFSGSGAAGQACIAGLMASVPYSVNLPATAPGALTVTSINGVPINANPFSFPDITINTSSPVVVNIQAQYIPPGTVPKLFISSSSGPDQTITCTPLTGTLQSSTSTASVTFPPNSGSYGYVKATWTQ